MIATIPSNEELGEHHGAEARQPTRSTLEMSYSLVLTKDEGPELTKDIGENVFLHDLSDEYKVFAFYYPSAMRDDNLENALRGLGDLTGKNLFVNIGKLDDPDFERIVQAFEIKTFPAIVVTATTELAGARQDDVTLFVRIDDTRLLSDPRRAVELVQELYGLFLRGEIADAVSKAKWKERSELVRAVATRIKVGLQKLGGFIADHDIKISVLEGSFELTKSA